MALSHCSQGPLQPPFRFFRDQRENVVARDTQRLLRIKNEDPYLVARGVYDHITGKKQADRLLNLECSVSKMRTAGASQNTEALRLRGVDNLVYGLVLG